MSSPARPRIGITLGDVTGIGPEIIDKALASNQLDRDGVDFEVIGDARTRRRADAVDWLVATAERCLAGDLAGMVTGPITKDLIQQAGYSFAGQTELLAHGARSERFAMMLAGGPLRVALVTTHLPLAQVASAITTRKIRDTIELSADFCRRIGIASPRIGVSGLNPHAGEGGLLGCEEDRLIRPAVQACRGPDLEVSGPWPADSLFYHAYRGGYDAVVAMYHDQGLAPFKMVAFDCGVNLTLGLPFVRTSPDHGTAHDLAGQNRARPDSMIAAINLATSLITPVP